MLPQRSAFSRLATLLACVALVIAASNRHLSTWVAEKGVTQLAPDADVFGSYLQSFGLGLNGYIYLAPGGSYSCCRIGCVQPYDIQEGRYSIDDDQITFSPRRAQRRQTELKNWKATLLHLPNDICIMVDGSTPPYRKIQHGSAQLYRSHWILQGFFPPWYANRTPPDPAPQLYLELFASTEAAIENLLGSRGQLFHLADTSKANQRSFHDWLLSSITGDLLNTSPTKLLDNEDIFFDF